jgi:hypothetical protein
MRETDARARPNAFSAEEAETEVATPHNGRQIRELKHLREQCLAKIKAATQSTILNEADVRAYEQMVISDEAYASVGVHSYEEKLRQLQQLRDRLIPDLIDDARQLEIEFLVLLGMAQKAGGISEGDVHRWMDRLHRKDVIYWKKKEFIEGKIKKEYFPNWLKLGKDLNDIDEKRKKLGLEPDELPELALLATKGFPDTHFSYKRDTADRALAALAAYEKNQLALYKTAKGLLEDAAKGEQRVLAPWKVGEWLRRIFQSGAKPNLIREFVLGNGEKSLSGLMRRWTKVRAGFDHIELVRREKGSPRSFHFVHLDVFLGWHYEQRRAYLEEAERRFTDIHSERGDFLKIRHALDARDWEEADWYLAKVPRGELSSEETEKLRSMEKFLREHRGKTTRGEGVEQTPGQLMSEIDALLRYVPHDLQELYKDELARGYGKFWVLCTLLYNRSWCFDHHYLTEEKELQLYDESKVLTEQRIKFGHGTGFEANDVTQGRNQRLPAIRDQKHVHSAQVLFVDETSRPYVEEAIEKQGGDRQFWYWTSLIPKGVSIEKHKELTHPGGINQQLKRLLRKLEAQGARYVRKSARYAHREGSRRAA